MPFGWSAPNGTIGPFVFSSVSPLFFSFSISSSSSKVSNPARMQFTVFVAKSTPNLSQGISSWWKLTFYTTTNKNIKVSEASIRHFVMLSVWIRSTQKYIPRDSYPPGHKSLQQRLVYKLHPLLMIPQRPCRIRALVQAFQYLQLRHNTRPLRQQGRQLGWNLGEQDLVWGR